DLMRITIRRLGLGAMLCTTMTACTLHHEYLPPALPASRAVWDMQEPFLLNNPPPPELMPVVQPPAPPGFVPGAGDWELWRAASKTEQQCRGRGTKRRCVTLTSIIQEANQGATVRPTRSTMGGGKQAMVRFPFVEDKIYDVQTSP